ncbi:MAG: DUF4173 domain-containing protein, partial [Clostridiales bacterium]|nr:DUF4173 domain-containing protein [Clostridiales bacterium]
MNNETIFIAEEPIPNGVRKTFTKLEKILLPVSLVIAVLFDRLMCAPLLDLGYFHIVRVCAGWFWLGWIIFFCAVYWKKLKGSIALWFVAACAAALCVWSIVFPEGNEPYSMWTYLVIPAVLMAHAQAVAGGFALKDAASIAAAWITGWLIKPFSGIPALAGSIGSLFSEGNRTAVKRVCIGLLAALALFLILIPLLRGADQMFGFYMDNITSGFNVPSLIFHGIMILIAFALFYSILWNVGFGKNKAASIPSHWRVDAIICVIVLGAVALLYILFCGIQFTYLFAGAGLPEGMTYSSYAREGFSQTVTVCAINLIMFGLFIRFGPRGRLLNSFLGLLLALTAVMLYSGAVRLNLYIGAYGLTWLRLLSAWFIIYLAAVI